MFRWLQSWKTSRLNLACPTCKEMAAPEVFRRGRYLAGETALRCDVCGSERPVTFWRFEGLSHHDCPPARKRSHATALPA